MKACITQFKIEAGNVDANFKKGISLIEQAKKEGCDLILLPEVWTTGFLFKKLKDLSKTTPEIIKELKRLSQNICICGTYVVDNPETDKVFNIFYAIKDGKVLLEYKKTMLFGLTGEDKYFNRGDFSQINTFTLNDIKIGVSVCYELRFPEFFRKSAFNGAYIHLHPAIWPKSRLNHWQTLTQARAIENQFFLLTSNGVGMSGKWELAGHSNIINGWGEFLKALNYDEGFVCEKLDINEVEQIRDQLTSLKDSINYLRTLYV
ncbi:nitrilase-related carbon-nitrogen hydrolase [Hippea maritima]|uniref:Nitrilase/cyanide hydratase and apolipoprotein N-acyltransferase n=1 Tax=Hippea maritima (strain ATCC 700847 / DSM 10411 / MH2) TaxID=760142 RepID=F2LU38_HIPMA|nr:nitrilase-related carbon-nitrogen hydrolase [Hippea maritima]AEA34501.1 Nitrilase/cyanide hydratase and apolipoprotein N-acyltransferase [Hippea maritima DSM 10411]